MPVLVQNENEQDEAHVFQEIYFRTSYIHQLAKNVSL